MANKIKLARGTKSRIESIKSGMLDYELVYSTDTNELGVKKPDGNVKYIGIDLDEIGYMNHAAKIFYDSNKRNQFKDAWEHSLTVVPSEIERASTASTQYGRLQYPNGEDNGVIIPDSVTSIGRHAFDGWSSNNQPLVIPNSVTSIGTHAFSDWSSNTQPLVIPNSVTSIGIGAFGNWSSNNKPLVIPNSVTSIGDVAFAYWMLVAYVEILAITPPTLVSALAFDNQNNAPIYVPDGSIDAYKTATNWVDLADRIFPISDKTGLMDDIADLQENKQDKLVAGDNITIDENTNVISASGGSSVETWNTATKTLALSDSNKLFKCTHTANQTLTIPTNATVAFPIGTMITFLLSSTYKVTFSGASGVTLTSIDSLVELATQFAMASLIKTDTNTWQLVGALE